MNTRNRYLTAALLLLIGVLIGGLLVLFQQGSLINDQANVNFTEIKTSEKPVFDDQDLENIDARFLFKNVADQVIPTVVYISTVVSLDGEERNDEGGSDFWDQFSSRRARTVGSGVIISEDGYIVTNNHVIRGAISDGIGVIVNDKRAFEARVVGTDPTTDLAILKIDAKNLPSIVIGNSDELEVGEWVLAIGNPFRLRSTVTAGIVSALSRQVQISGETDNGLRIDSYIQTDAAINKGNSGGALVNTSGELIGINTAIASQSGSYQGYGFAVPSNLVKKVVRDLIEYGEVHRALLGVSILGIDYSRAQELGLNAVRGVEIIALTEDGAAQKYNLKENDVIFSVNGEPVNEPNELQEKIAVLRPGETAQLNIWRDGETMQKDIVLGRLQSPDPSFTAQEEPDDQNELGRNDRRGVAFGTFSLGFKVMALATPEDSQVYDLIISEVFSSSEAARQGLKEGYIIKKVNDADVQTLEQLNKQLSVLKEGANILMEVETPEGVIGYYQLRK
ncbi:MAG: trypsin-like peptidase domain-containing protein [Balneolaceae bacterium]|nr:trypsin-like peptidase domain-containing protein [Balneolaceae bacterium]